MKNAILAVSLALFALMAHGQVLNPGVTVKKLRTTVCSPNWTKTVRPSTNYTDKVKKRKLREAGLPTDAETMKLYELDHIVPLVLGGHPTDSRNLQPQRWDGAWNAHMKDALEVRVHREVCAGGLTLEQGQQVFMGDWRTAYREYFGEPQ